MNYQLHAHLIYLVVSLAATVWVARTLFKNGRIFLVDTFAGNEALADSVNSLLVAGFYLINIGYVAMALRADRAVSSYVELLESVCPKVGTVLIILGVIHFMNMFVFARTRTFAIRRQDYLNAQATAQRTTAPNLSDYDG